MIKLFRQIRQNLLSEGKTEKYFKYAIGEIVLVVIGILIALQINNWNDNRKAKKQESTYYCKISEDLQTDIVNIDSSIVSIDKRLESTERLLTNLLKIQQDKEVLLNDFISTIRHYRFIPTKAAIVDITSSGKLEKLTDENVKTRVLSHYTQQDIALNIIDINYNAISERLFDLKNFADFGFQEVPQYQNFYSEELQDLLTSSDWHQNPDDELYMDLKDIMVLNVIQLHREKQLLNQIKDGSVNLYKLLDPYCN